MKFTCKKLVQHDKPPPHFVYTQKKCKITHKMKTTNFCANQLNKLLGRYLLLMECLSHLPMKSHILVHYIICGRQRFFCFRFFFFFFFVVIVDRHFISPICIGLFPYFILCWLFAFFCSLGCVLLMLSFALYFWWMGSCPWFLYTRFFFKKKEKVMQPCKTLFINTL